MASASPVLKVIRNRPTDKGTQLPSYLPLAELVREMQAPVAQLRATWAVEDWMSLLKALRYSTADAQFVLHAWRAMAPVLQQLVPDMPKNCVVAIVWSMQSLHVWPSEDGGWQEQLLRAIADRISQRTEVWRSDHVARCLIGLKNVGSESPAARRLLVLLAQQTQACSSKFTAQDLVNSLYGMWKMTTNHAEVRGMVAALVPQIRHVSGLLTGQGVGNLLYGMQGMDSEHSEVRDLITAIVPLIEASTAELNEQEIGNALFGFQNTTTHVTGVESLLTAMASKISRSPARLGSQAVGMALYGLNRMTAQPAGVRAVLRALMQKMELPPIPTYTDHSIVSMCFGLRNMRADSIEVRAILRFLAERLSVATLQLPEVALAVAISGLRRMSSEHQEVQEVLSKMGEHLARVPAGVTTPRNVANILVGLRSMSEACVPVQNIMRLLASSTACWDAEWTASRLATAFGSLYGNPAEHSCTHELLRLLTDQLVHPSIAFTDIEFAQVLNGLQSMQATQQEVRAVLAALTLRLQDSSCVLTHGEALLACLDGLKCLDKLPKKRSAKVSTFVKEFMRWVERSNIRLPAQQLLELLHKLEAWNPQNPIPAKKLSIMLMSAAASRARTSVESADDHDHPQHSAGSEIGDALAAVPEGSAELSTTRAYLTKLAESITSNPSLQLSDDDIAHTLRNMAHISDSHEEEASVIDAVATKIVNSPATLTNASISAIVGMRHLTGKSDATIELLTVLMGRIKQLPDRLSEQAVRSALSGMAMIVTHNPETADMVTDLLGQLQLTYQELGIETVCAAMTAVANAPTRHAAVKRLIRALAILLRDSKGNLSSKMLGAAAVAIGSMEIGSRETLQLVAALTTKLRSATKQFKPEAIGVALANLENLPKGIPEVEKLISELSTKAKKVRVEFSSDSIADAIFALHKLGSDSESTLKLISALADKLSASNAAFSGVDIGKSLFGLENMDSARVEVQKLLSALTAKVNGAKTTMGAHSISTAVHGLQRLGSKRTETKLLLYSLAQQIERSQAKLEGMDASAAVYGLREMDPSAKSVRALIRALADKLDHAPSQPFQKQELIVAVAGLAMMDEQHAEVRQLIAAVTKHILHPPALAAIAMQGHELGTLLSGLSSLTGTSVESQELLTKLAQIIEHGSVQSADTVTTQRVMMGVRRLNGSIEAVQALLSALLPKINLADGLWTDKVASEIISGLQNKGTEHATVRQLISMIAAKLVQQPVSWSAAAVETLVHGLAGLIHDCDELRTLLRVLTAQISASPETLQPRTIWTAEANLQHFRKDFPEAEQFLLALRAKETKKAF